MRKKLSDLDPRFSPRNATETWRNSVKDIGGKDYSLCARTEKLLKEGRWDSTFVRVHLERCEDCRKKFSQ